MSYRFEPNESVAGGIKRIATEQIDKALDQLENKPEGLDEAVHDARKRFKKIRAVLRLVRKEIDGEVYQTENVCFRNAGRRLAALRDSYVMVKTLDDLAAHYAAQLATDAFDPIRQKLQADYQAVKTELIEHDEAIIEVVDILGQARDRIKNWPIMGEGFSTLVGGLLKVYTRGRKRMAEAYAEPTPEKFHEWRKRVKYLWYHTRILKPVWSDPFSGLADEVHNLADYLGDAHDMAELEETLAREPARFEAPDAVQVLIALLIQRRQALERTARPLAERIYFEEPGAFVDRVAAYWQAWQHGLALRASS